MIAGLKPYPKYKDSGVGWLGEVPEGWEVRRLANIFDRIVGGATPASSTAEYWGGDIVWATPTDVVSSSKLSDSDRHLTSEGLASCSASLVPPGSIILTSRAPVGNVAVAAVSLATNQGCKALVPCPNTLDPGFALLLVTTMAPEIKSRSVGTTFYEVSYSVLRAIPGPFPPLQTQRAIAGFLTKTAECIERSIANRQRLIELLEEEKQAVIHRAVTRGLDPDVQLKPSGVDWLGDVPEHWEIRRLHELAEPRRPIMYGIVLPGPHADDGVPLVKGGDCEPDRLSVSTLSRVAPGIESKHARSRLVAGDIVIAIRGGVGAAALIPVDLTGANLTQDAARISHRSGVSNEWLLQAVESPVAQEHIAARIRGATVRGINIRDLKRIPLVVPPLEEQEEIAEFVRRGTARAMRAASNAQRQITLLDELRTRLISDVVTGKLDVREVAARLPADPDEVDAVLEEAVEGAVT